jgi:hypothetical protein
MADIDTYQDRIRKNTDKLRVEKDNRKRAVLQKKIQRDRINIELETLKISQ